MDSDNVENISIASVICAIVFGLAALGMYGCHQIEETKREAMRQGLSEKMQPASFVTTWSKE